MDEEVRLSAEDRLAVSSDVRHAWSQVWRDERPLGSVRECPLSRRRGRERCFMTPRSHGGRSAVSRAPWRATGVLTASHRAPAVPGLRQARESTSPLEVRAVGAGWRNDEHVVLNRALAAGLPFAERCGTLMIDL